MGKMRSNDVRRAYAWIKHRDALIGVLGKLSGDGQCKLKFIAQEPDDSWSEEAVIDDIHFAKNIVQQAIDAAVANLAAHGVEIG